MSQTKKQYKPTFSDDPLRGWILKVIYKNGSMKEVTVDPAGYESVLKDPLVESVDIIRFVRFAHDRSIGY